MPRKGQTTRKREPPDADVPRAESPPELKLAAFEILSGSLACAVIQSGRKVNSTNIQAIIEESTTLLDDHLTPARVRELLPDPANTFIVTTEECYPNITPVRQAGFDVTPIERTRAIHSAHEKQAGGEPCLILSIEENRTICSLFVNGRIVNSREDSAALSLATIWRNYITADRSWARTVEFHASRNLTFEPGSLEAFRSAWKTGKAATAGKYAFSEIDLTSSFPSLWKLICETDPGRTARAIILSDWAAAYSNLSSLLAPEFRVVGDDDPGRAFKRAFEGLVLFGLNRIAFRPELKLIEREITFNRIGKGESARADFNIQNIAGGSLQAKFMSGDPWLKITPEAVTCGKGGKEQVYVDVETSNLAVGITQTHIEIKWSDNFRIRKNNLPVRIEVVAPRPSIAAAARKILPKTTDVPVVAPIPEAAPAIASEAESVSEAAALAPAALIARLSEEELSPPERKGIPRIGYAALVLMVVGFVVLFVALYPRARPSNMNANLKGQSQNGNIATANPLVTLGVTPATGPSTAPSPNNSPNSQSAILTVYANTDGVQVSVDGNQFSLVGKYEVKRLMLAPGQHFVKATKEGYTPWESSVELAQGSTRTVNLVLQQTQTAAAAPAPTPLPSEIAHAYYLRATELFGAKDYDEALSQCKSGLAIDPANDSLLSLKARIEARMEKIQEILAKPRETVQPQATEAIPVTTSNPITDRVEPPKLISQGSPVYPPSAKDAKISGTVMVAVSLDDQGRVIAASAVEGPALLRSAAVEAAKRCTFRPARRGGRPIASALNVPFNFVLK
jgi:TonB family protein